MYVDVHLQVYVYIQTPPIQEVDLHKGPEKTHHLLDPTTVQHPARFVT